VTLCDLLNSDDAAIAEAVAQVETELQRENKAEEGGGAMLTALAIAASAVGLYFLKFR
jgi:hypothetical protein